LEELVMNARRQSALVLVSVVVALAASSPASAADEDAFYKASYLQTEERDFDEAAKLFAVVADQDDATPKIREAARKRLLECREELAAADLASLMPPDAILYVQVANIGDQATTLLEALGVAGEETASGAKANRIPLEPGLSIPTDIGLSPALVREIGKLGGVAAAIRGFDSRGVPEGVAIVHLGGSDLVRGLVETGLQIVTPSESIGNYTTYHIPAEGENVWLVKTERLLVFSNSRDEAAAAVGRLDAEAGGESLKDAESFRAAAEARGESLLFAWADSQRAAPIVDALMANELRGEELVAARTVLNLQQIESATFSLGATEGGVRGEAAIRFMPGHQHLLYGLVHTAPIGEDALRHVPAAAGAVAAIGLNPPVIDGDNGAAGAPQLALMDIGRELFANVRSISVFVAPSESAIPEVGVVIYAQNGEKSKQLWGRLMALPAMFGVLPAEAVKEVELRGRPATQYLYPEAPPIFVAQPSEQSLLIGTAGAVEASLAALDDGESLAGQQDGVKLIERIGPSTSKAVIVRGGQLFKCAEPSLGPHERRELTAVAPLLNDLTASLTVDEEPNELRVRVEVTGVPRVGEVLRAISGRATELQAPPELQAATAP